MKIKNLFLWVLLIAMAIGNFSCTKDSNKETLPFDDGVFVICQGTFMNGSGTLSFADRKTGVVQNDIFQTVNGMPLGNVVQSMEIFNDKAYIMVNNAGKAVVADAGTLQYQAEIPGLTLPRYFIGINKGKGYISDWSNTIAVVDLKTNTIIKILPTGNGPDKMLKVDDKVFVLNGGGYGVDSTITVINSATDEVIATLQIGRRPTGICCDANNKVWVMCSGQGFNGWPQTGDSEAHLMCINPSSLNIEKDFSFPGNTDHAENLAINAQKTKLYYVYKNGIYEFAISSNTLSNEALFSTGINYYAIGLDKETGYLYCADPVDYVQNGWIYRFDPTTVTKIDSFQTGVIPGEFYFR